MSTSEPRTAPPGRDIYRRFYPMTTRWMDNDVYNHVNNAVYYSYIDSAVNGYLQETDALREGVIGLVVETGCRYHASVSYPDLLDIGVAVVHVGNSSIRYEVGIFRHGQPVAAASAYFVHVYVDPATRRPKALPPTLRQAAEAIRR